MVKRILSLFSVAGFTAIAGYFWKIGDAEIAVGVIGILVTIIIALWQTGSSEKEKRGSWLRSLFSVQDFKKQYYTVLRYQNRDFDIKGLSTQTESTLELDQVFVELKLQQQAAHNATADPLQNVPSKFRKDSYSIWRYFNLLGDEKALNPKLAIVGPPGSGKTTLLRHMSLLLAKAPQRDEDGRRKINKLPVILFLRDHVSDITGTPSIMLSEIIESNLKKWAVTVAPNWFSKRLKKGGCLVMLDGLDEVAEPAARRKIVSWLEKQIHAYPGNAFIITSRPHGYKENPVHGFNVLEVMPFNRAQIDTFVQRWYLANEVKSHHNVDDPGVRMAAKSGADDLLRRLEKNATLMELAVNPLLLTMIATVHRYRSALPGRRVELYKEICEVFLGKRQESKGLSIDMVPAQKQSVLQSLAYQMMGGSVREVRKPDAIEIIKPSLAMVAPTLSPEVFLKSIEQQTGLLLERELGIYSFAHKTFQEYLASMYILDQNLESELYDYIDDDWWHEVIKLYSAQSDATQIITVCLDQDPPSAKALSLAIQCLEEAHQVKPELREIAEKILLQNAEDEDPDIRTIIGEALLSNRLKHLSALSPTLFIDTKLVTNAEYQVFVDDMLVRGSGDFHPVHWMEKSFPTGTAHHPATGLTPDDALAFCEWLTRLHAGSGEWYFRLPVKQEVAPRNYSSLPGFWMLERSVNRNPKTSPPVEIFKNPNFTWPQPPPQFLQKTTQEDIKVIISSIRHDGRDLRELNDDFHVQLGRSLKRLVRSTSKSDELLVETADTIYNIIKDIPSVCPVDFGYGATDLEAYDQSLSDNIDKIANRDFESCIINSIKCFSELIRTNVRSSSRFKPLYLAFTFEFLTHWMHRNKSMFTRTRTEGIQRKIDYLADQYMDELIVLGRRNNLIAPFEGLLFVKETRKEE
jgi:energy-coupling factor transporter ATP-binding protein EcfA2